VSNGRDFIWVQIRVRSWKNRILGNVVVWLWFCMLCTRNLGRRINIWRIIVLIITSFFVGGWTNSSVLVSSKTWVYDASEVSGGIDFELFGGTVFRWTCCCSAMLPCGWFEYEAVFEGDSHLFGVVFCLSTCNKIELVPLFPFLPLFGEGLSVKSIILIEEKFYAFLPLCDSTIKFFPHCDHE
jgi:hypothetical protein